MDSSSLKTELFLILEDGPIKAQKIIEQVREMGERDSDLDGSVGFYELSPSKINFFLEKFYLRENETLITEFEAHWILKSMLKDFSEEDLGVMSKLSKTPYFYSELYQALNQWRFGCSKAFLVNGTDEDLKKLLGSSSGSYLLSEWTKVLRRYHQIIESGLFVDEAFLLARGPEQKLPRVLLVNGFLAYPPILLESLGADLIEKVFLEAPYGGARERFLGWVQSYFLEAKKYPSGESFSLNRDWDGFSGDFKGLFLQSEESLSSEVLERSEWVEFLHQREENDYRKNQKFNDRGSRSEWLLDRQREFHTSILKKRALEFLKDTFRLQSGAPKRDLYLRWAEHFLLSVSNDFEIFQKQWSDFYECFSRYPKGSNLNELKEGFSEKGFQDLCNLIDHWISFQDRAFKKKSFGFWCEFFEEWIGFLSENHLTNKEEVKACLSRLEKLKVFLRLESEAVAFSGSEILDLLSVESPSPWGSEFLWMGYREQGVSQARGPLRLSNLSEECLESVTFRGERLFPVLWRHRFRDFGEWPVVEDRRQFKRRCLVEEINRRESCEFLYSKYDAKGGFRKALFKKEFFDVNEEPSDSGGLRPSEPISPIGDSASLPIGSGFSYESFRKEEAIWSVSRLERFIKCPFDFYARYRLGAEDAPRVSLEPRPVELGKYYHRLAELFFSDSDRVQKLRQLSADEIEASVESFLVEKGKKEQNLGLWDHVLGDRSYRESLLKRVHQRLKKLFVSELLIFKEQKTRSVFANEFSFKVLIKRGMESSSKAFTIEPLADVLDLSGHCDGHSLVLRGSVDRVDLIEEEGRLYFEILDYKSSESSVPTKGAIEKAESLQLPLYMAVLSSLLESKLGRKVYAKPGAYPTISLGVRKAPLFSYRKEDHVQKLIERGLDRAFEIQDLAFKGEFLPKPLKKDQCPNCVAFSICAYPHEVEQDESH
jgi:RecB family exonuclease